MTKNIVIVIVIVPGPAGTWALCSGGRKYGQFKSFRDAQTSLRSLLGPDEFARRFPATADVLEYETKDRRPAGGWRAPAA